MNLIWSILWRAAVLFYPIWLGLAAVVGFVFLPDEQHFDVATFTGYLALVTSPVLAAVWVRRAKR